MKKLCRSKHFHRLIKVVIVIFVLGLTLPVTKADASQVTSASDTLTRLKASTNANHTIQFVTPTGVAAGQTIILTFTGFGSSSVNAITFSDVDFAEGNSSCASFSEKTLAASPSGSTWGISAGSAAITITSGTGTVTAGNCLRIKIGTNATSGTTGTNQIQNGSAGTGTIAITGTFTDTGTIAIPIISNDEVTVTASVDPTITFTVTQNAVAFGSLNVGSARYANTSSGTNTETSAHNVTAATNAASGYTITVTGDTLKSGSNSITAYTTAGGVDVTGASNFGWGLHISASGGSGAVDSDYSGTSPNKYYYGGTTSVSDTIASASAPSNTTTYSIYYGANVSATQQAGSYSTTLTYIATANF